MKFRPAEPLKVLDAVRQSGGERMVATTMYLLSLQVIFSLALQEKSDSKAVSRIPFRVMDEINHGMDEENERRVMNILGSKVGQGSMPQTFVFTPKMFSNPEFILNATIHMLANGDVQYE